MVHSEGLARYRGSLFGLAIGDAFGATYEFSDPLDAEPIPDLVGGGVFGLKPGQWTDDTSLALCLAASLVECKRFEPGDHLERYLRWYRTGYMSSTGRCFDIGHTTRLSLDAFEAHGVLERQDPPHSEAGNGSIMRLTPVPMAYARDPNKAIELSGESSRTTHSLQICVDAVGIWAPCSSGHSTEYPRRRY